MSDPEFIFVFHKLLGTQIFMSSQVIGIGSIDFLEKFLEEDQTYVPIYVVPLCISVCYILDICMDVYVYDSPVV